VSVIDALGRGVQTVRFGAVMKRIQDVGHGTEPALSVFLGTGVVPRAERPDNHNSLGRDLDKYQLVKPGDLVFNRLRTWQGGFGASRHRGIVSPAYIVARPQGKGDARYLDYVLHSAPYLAELTRVSKWMPPSQFDVLWSDLRNVTVPWPEVAEQRRIADFLDDRVARIDQIITARRQQLALLVPRRRAAVLNALIGLPRIPLRRLLRGMATGGTPSPESDTPEGLSWFSPGAFQPDLTLGEPTRLVAASDCVIFPARTLVIVGIGATAGKVAWLDKRASGNQQLTCLESDDKVSEARFLLHQLDAMRDALLGSAPAATLPIINNETLRAFKVAVADVQVQRRLAAEWDTRLAADSAIEVQLTASIELLAEYKQSLITAAVTGELDVTTAGSGIPG
jgi:type I restriction enzyme S subunit